MATKRRKLSKTADFEKILNHNKPLFDIIINSIAKSKTKFLSVHSLRHDSKHANCTFLVRHGTALADTFNSDFEEDDCDKEKQDIDEEEIDPKEIFVAYGYMHDTEFWQPQWHPEIPNFDIVTECTSLIKIFKEFEEEYIISIIECYDKEAADYEFLYSFDSDIKKSIMDGDEPECKKIRASLCGNEFENSSSESTCSTSSDDD